MVIIASKRMGSMMLVAALILWSSVGADADAHILLSRRWKCIFHCWYRPDPVGCFHSCYDRVGGSLTFAASEHCDIGCFVSTCLAYHLDTKKVGLDVNKVGACADSCSQSCQKTYSLH
ncbi:uncharacterized protein LOC130135038 [Syzygium oleosum]|uniref:uncharacterized protein LOC130135038 n=1 Tax=Syzygium oleosum TaxID=219896 RepID=UPI0024BB719D|nr:uncharacterized protein LOC130135038 [Syzygium oleosum]